MPGGENGWKLELISSGSRRQFDTNAVIDRYDKRIATSVLADFVMLGQQQVGSFALADNKTKIFAMAIGTYLDTICEVFNNQGIPRLIDINGDHFKGITDYPTMVHGDIEDKDVAQFSDYVTKMVGAGILVPDESLEDEVRRVGGLPEKMETSAPYGVQPGEHGPQQPPNPQQTPPKAKTTPQEAAGAPQRARNQKDDKTSAEDEKDAREAVEARKSLRRRILGV